MRISSSTASTLAIPARKIAWLSARISLSICQRSQKNRFELLRVPHELVRVDHAGYTPAFSTFSGFVGAYHPSFALDGYILRTARHVRGQRDFKLHRRANFQGSVGPD